ncbi:sugar transporter [Delitschia confertaspora ATCC 74209]|uniref:Sugar transporter n=1 Tax=Delitschia confertaspora ATCC 74209 TaxID=1513339 RepID=A0A9P4JK14_9PLEO|nr:sugar transporter [Delitschia confertaspora ATCC 74209]
MAKLKDKKNSNIGKKDVCDNGRNVVEKRETTGVNPTFTTIIATHKPNPFGKGYLKLYLLASVCFLNSTMQGFDSSLMGSINVLSNFTTYYNLPITGTTSTGIVFSIFQIGQMCGALFVWIADWQGRRRFIFIGTIGVILGTIVTATAKTLPTFIGGRFLLAFFATCACSASPLYLVEIAPPQYRGTLAGMYNTFYYFGSILATSAVYGAHKHLQHSGNLDWRLPLWLQMVCPGLVLLVILFYPESPRWLIAKDRHAEARDFLIKYHANGDPYHPLVALEMTEMMESLKNEPVTNWRNFFDLSVLYKTKARRYRTMLNMSFAWFGQFSGNNIISYYMPYMVANVGITSPDTKLLLNILYALVSYIFATAGARFHDVFGRRKMLMGATLGLIVALAATAGTAAAYVHSESRVASYASIAFIFVFGAVFAWAYTSMQPIYPTEVMSNDMRAKGMGTYKITGGAAGFINTFAAPTALAKIGYWFYIFFIFWDMFELAFMYFFFVETKGRTLEEMDAIFEAKNPRKASTAVKNGKFRRVIEVSGTEAREATEAAV